MAEDKEFSTVTIRTGIDPTFLTDTLTTDIELTDALFDLIDNSIDAARNHIVQTEYEKDEYGLPNDYSGFEIKIRFTATSIVIVDNCIGVETETLVNNTFYTGKRSNHKYGIGHYGLGLKRALLKAGCEFGLVTDNGNYLYKSVFDTESFSGNSEKKLQAKQFPSTGRRRTMLVVSSLKENVISQVNDQIWFDNATQELKVRYSNFIRKGLTIKVVNSLKVGKKTLTIWPAVPEIRLSPLVHPIVDKIVDPNVNIDFTVGIHDMYRFAGEYDHNAKENEKLTKTYGLYFICNDRVIVAATKEAKYGFTTQWHSEYGGFVCRVNITAENPAYLPWNTSKTELKVNSSLFLKLRKKIEPLALKYRSDAKKLINIWLDKSTKELPKEERKAIFAEKAGLPINPINRNNIPDIGLNSPEKSNTEKTKGSSQNSNSNTQVAEGKPALSSKPKARPSVNHARDRMILVDWGSCKTSVPTERTKEFDIFAELCKLSSKDTPISCVVMLRVFLETTVKQTAIKLGITWKNLSSTTKAVSLKLHGLGHIDHVIKDLALQYANTEGGLFTINNIQSQIHSVRHHPNQSKVNAYWDELDPFLAGCWCYISEQN
jgi:hypothetical protein